MLSKTAPKNTNIHNALKVIYNGTNGQKKSQKDTFKFYVMVAVGSQYGREKND